MPDIGQPSASDKNTADEIRDGVVTDSTRFPGGFIDERITDAGAAVQIVGQFQLTSASFAQSFDVGPQDGVPEGLTLKPDGSQLYVVGRGNAKVYQYSLSTAFDVSSASFVRSFDVSTQDGSPRGLAFKPDGSRLYVAGRNNANLFQYSLSTAYDISTASLTKSFSVTSQINNFEAVVFRPDGSQLFAVGSSNAAVFEYSLSTAFDVSSASFVKSFGVGSQDGLPTGLAFKPDGSQLYVVGDNTDTVFQYSLTTDFDVSTASLLDDLDVSSQDGTPAGAVFKPDGSQLYIVGTGNKNVFQYVVGTLGVEL